MSASSSFMAFAPAPAGICQLVNDGVACRIEAQGLWPLPRRMCREHALRWLDPGFVGCGCGPEPCPTCRRHLDSGLRVVVVGERENGKRDHPFNSDQRIAEAIGKDTDSRRAVLQFHKRRRAFSWGASRKRLIDLGLRWDLPINLLGSSPICGEWDRGGARLVATALAPHLATQFDRVVLLGVRVLEAFEGLLHHRRVSLPHPSGRSHYWNNPHNIGYVTEIVDVMYTTGGLL